MNAALLRISDMMRMLLNIQKVSNRLHMPQNDFQCKAL